MVIEPRQPEFRAVREAFLATILQTDILNPNVTVQVLVLREEDPDQHARCLFAGCVKVPEALALFARWDGKADVYVGMQPRHRPIDGLDGVDHVHVLYADCDNDEQVRGLFDFPLAPSWMWETSPGRLQAAWKTDRPIPVSDAKILLRRLSATIPSDQAAANAAHRLRVPGTHNCKLDHVEANGGKPCQGRVIEMDLARVCVRDEFEQTLEPEVKPAPRSTTSAPYDVNDPHEQLTPEQYFPVIADVSVEANTTISCPLPDHPDATPSCHIYDDHWHCFGCNRGGRIYQLAGAMLGYRVGRGELVGEAFRHTKRATELALGDAYGKTA